MEPRTQDRNFFVFNAVVSVAALGLLSWLLLIRRGGAGDLGVDLRFMPGVNAALNATAAVLLSCGYWAIRNRKPDRSRCNRTTSCLRPRVQRWNHI